MELGESYAGQRYIFDLASMDYILLDYTDEDHSSSWNKICERVNRFLRYINDLEVGPRIQIGQYLIDSYPDYFMLTKDGRVEVTEYFRECLYNYTGNLACINRHENEVKNKKALVNWLSGNRWYGQKFVNYFTISGEEEGQLRLEDIIDMSGFTPRVSNHTRIHPDLRRLALANAAKKYAKDNYVNGDLAEMKSEEIKSQRVLDEARLISETDQDKENLNRIVSARKAAQQSENRQFRDTLRQQFGDRLGILAKATPKKYRERDRSGSAGSDGSSHSQHTSDEDDVSGNPVGMAKLRMERRRRILAEIQLAKEAQARAAAEIKSIKMAMMLYDAAGMTNGLEDLGLTPEKAREIINQHESGTSKK